jgi:GDP-D-mannose dehydratase
MKKALITGVTGQDGAYLSRALDLTPKICTTLRVLMVAESQKEGNMDDRKGFTPEQII